MPQPPDSPQFQGFDLYCVQLSVLDGYVGIAGWAEDRAAELSSNLKVYLCFNCPV
ncbi:hypothetical protein DEO72_LG9g2615 [Vigna unguiculata]|uniref:Uncharacterized protein n=1 Tax=Vigna unguiculata TaxID=3917 RepID=A0A4D6N624_VIGUN|nr:hypothetical protein DEO72_LG9g2615 [Vigna unguiculata]